MVPCRRFHIDRFGGAKRLENVLKSSLGMVKQAIKGKEKVFVGKGVLIM